MQIIKSESYITSRSNKNKKYDPNPWAVCTDSVSREDKSKFERCVKEVKGKASKA